MKLKPLLSASGGCTGDDAGISTGASTPGAAISSAAGGGGGLGATISAGELGGRVSGLGMLIAFPCSKVADGMLFA